MPSGPRCTAEIVRKQVFSEDLARRLEGQLREIEQRRLEAVSLDKQLRARYDRLASDPRVKQALATLNESGDYQDFVGTAQG